MASKCAGCVLKTLYFPGEGSNWVRDFKRMYSRKKMICLRAMWSLPALHVMVMHQWVLAVTPCIYCGSMAWVLDGVNSLLWSCWTHVAVSCSVLHWFSYLKSQVNKMKAGSHLTIKEIRILACPPNESQPVFAKAWGSQVKFLLLSYSFLTQNSFHSSNSPPQS